MKEDFKEKLLHKASKLMKKNILLKPFVWIFLGIFLFLYNVFNYFKNNFKRYITIGVVCIFFFMSSSFSNIDNADSEVYLSEILTPDSLPELSESTEMNDLVKVQILDDSDEIISGALISEEFEKELESTKNIDTFTIDDFLRKYDDVSVAQTNESELTGFDKNAWYLILVNKTHPLPDDYEMELAEFSGNMKCDVRVLDILLNMLNAAKKDGVNLIVCSPYRDYALQERLFNKKVNLYVSYGYSYMDAYKLASRKVIVPGASEHQLGLAFDIVTDYHAVLDYEFGDTEAGLWLKNHCSEYGFILRYPRGKEELTGIEYEPWHFRYVGVDAATYIMNNGLTLEEFIEGL